MMHGPSHQPTKSYRCSPTKENVNAAYGIESLASFPFLAIISSIATWDLILTFIGLLPPTLYLSSRITSSFPPPPGSALACRLELVW
ncbi:hypothetical protein E2C01_052478 [Portunus trituberculatus]|uniref:Uncharacterized protein n=1 Tax=Portunus trituberculatus TaxID=210409 RepID=A0A5B7GLX2_PORTR|nr:hypothetical protein [Portunus trituberculatus]